MDSARSKQRAFSRAIPAFVKPACNLLGAHGPGGPIAFTGQPKSQPNDVRLDGLNLNALFLFRSDNFDIEGSITERDDSSVGISTACILLHRPCRGPRRFAGLIFIDDSNELAEHISGIVFGERLRK